MTKNLIRASIIVAPLLCAIAALAQGDTQFKQKTRLAPGALPVHGAHGGVVALAPQLATYDFVGAHVGMEGKVVKNSPYSAEGVTETTKVLADGTRISRSHTSKIFRDSEGRTRREISMGNVGALASEDGGVTMVTINDPVKKRMYIMREGEKKAKSIELIHPDSNIEVKELTSGDETHVKIIRKEYKAKKMVVHSETGGSSEMKGVLAGHDFSVAAPHALHAGGDSKEEDLGERSIEGVLARGTKTTSVIPAGKIGNDRPIEIVGERWYSDELQAVVRSETRDPMSGNVVYKLTNVIRAEPDPSLFEIPTEVVVEEGTGLHREIHIEHTVEQEHSSEKENSVNQEGR